MFKKFGFEIPEHIITGNQFSQERVNLPSLYEIENLLSGAENLIKDLAAIKAIGEYLKKIELPKVDEKYDWHSRGKKREKALELIS